MPNKQYNWNSDSLLNWFLPAIAVVEAIGTKGKSHGETALTAMSNIETGRQNRIQAAKEARMAEEVAVMKAMDKRLKEAQITDLGYKQENNLWEKTRKSELDALERKLAEGKAFNEAEKLNLEKQKFEWNKLHPTNAPKPISEETNSRLMVDKNKRKEEFIKLHGENQYARDNLLEAEKALNRLPAGLKGKIEIEYKKRINPNDPMLGEWQKVKSVLTNAQLLYTAQTKGAITDKEMALFESAAANDDLSSIPRIKEVIKKMKNKLDSIEKSTTSSYKAIYNENPYDLIGGESVPVNIDNDPLGLNKR